MIAWEHLTPIERAQLKSLGYYQEKKGALGWIVNGCEKCGGDLMPDKDDYEYFHKCLQCGWIKRYHGTLPYNNNIGRSLR